MLYIVLNILFGLALISLIVWAIIKVVTAAANHPQTTAKALVALVSMMILFGCYMTSNAEEAVQIPELYRIDHFDYVGIFDAEGELCLRCGFNWHGQELELLFSLNREQGEELNLNTAHWVTVNPANHDIIYIGIED